MAHDVEEELPSLPPESVIGSSSRLRQRYSPATEVSISEEMLTNHHIGVVGNPYLIQQRQK